LSGRNSTRQKSDFRPEIPASIRAEFPFLKAFAVNAISQRRRRVIQNYQKKPGKTANGKVVSCVKPRIR